jgi:hypothetical protein
MRLLESRTATDIDTVVDALNCHSTALAERIAVAPILKFDAVQVLVATSRRRHYSDKSGRDDVCLLPLDDISLARQHDDDVVKFVGGAQVSNPEEDGIIPVP